VETRTGGETTGGEEEKLTPPIILDNTNFDDQYIKQLESEVV
jgi:hypothetical protein